MFYTVTKKIYLFLLMFLLVALQFCLPAAASSDKSSSAPEDTDFGYYDTITYSDYLLQNQNSASVNKDINIDAKNFFKASTDLQVTEYQSVSSVEISENNSVTYSFSTEETGYYNIQLSYFPTEISNSSIKFELLIDDAVPFKEAKSVSLKRVWRDESEKLYDNQGNQIRRPAKQTPEWLTCKLFDINGYSQEPLCFYFTRGIHTLTINVYQSSLVLSEINLTVPKNLLSYSDIQKEYAVNGYKQSETAGNVVEAEYATAKSDRSIVISNDRISTETMPYHPYLVRYNAIGGSSWKTVGEWIEWELEAPNDGLYTIEMRWKQALKINDVSSRSLYIDGVIPFEEAKSLSFVYNDSWQSTFIGDGSNPYLFYLTKGKHIVRLEASLGQYSKIISAVSSVLNDLNGIYTDIVMVTGLNPDVDRDYQFDRVIPDVINEIKNVSGELKEIKKELDEFTGGGQSTALMERLYKQLDKMYEEPDTISKALNNFETNITSLGTWINTSREQPLEIDYLKLSNTDTSFERGSGNLLKSLKHHAVQFITSFVTDYTSIGDMNTKAETKITVWTGNGRDQADILRQLINEDFTPNYNIGVNVQLVNPGALLPAILANIGPDVYVGMTEEKPVDYALRNAVVSLSDFEGIEEVLKCFYPDSLEPFRLDGKLYALPETMSYPVLFYRKDILTKLNIKYDDLSTWNSLLQKVLPELDMNYFDFGLPSNLKMFTSFLYQNGGTLYNDSNTASALYTKQAIKAFQDMTTIFTDYGVPKSYDFVNRFRSGQMPLAVAEYTVYNQLSVFAPEIEGMWGIMPIPGYSGQDGNVNNTAVCTVTGSVIFSGSKSVKAAWEFLKWWTSGDVQSRYGTDLETIMGTGARYATANTEAMNNIEWEFEIKSALNRQLQTVIGIPQIAGGYYTTRHFDFAFRDVVYNGENLRETIASAAENITNEITDKRKEFYGG